MRRALSGIASSDEVRCEYEILIPGVIHLLQLVVPREHAILGGSTENSLTESTTQAEACIPKESLGDSTHQFQAREEAASSLWDVTQSERPASIAVDHAALDILPRVLLHAIAHDQLRLAELLMGSLANILCHPPLAKLVSSLIGLSFAVPSKS